MTRTKPKGCTRFSKLTRHSSGRMCCPRRQALSDPGPGGRSLVESSFEPETLLPRNGDFAVMPKHHLYVFKTTVRKRLKLKFLPKFFFFPN
ncbi:hypothetical protein AVEN_15635-1 [Araneus ventricosus]|uniref:Uncharacterized protein n=1 Tax=Araneus ventricosus TaxID=182803 RepID=A0A4Y2LN87_ARAVE|nr:hypothetical protein AVEN_15635-1 [Araneus ventricosus]